MKIVVLVHLENYVLRMQKADHLFYCTLNHKQNPVTCMCTLTICTVKHMHKHNIK